MALAVLAIGIVLVVVGYRGTYADLAALIAGDLPGFLPWLAALALIGAIGYAPGLEDLSNSLLALVILVIVLANAGAWQNIVSAFTGPQQAVPAVGTIPTAADRAALATPPVITVQTIGSGGGGSGQSSGGSDAGGALGLFGGIAKGLLGIFGG